MTFWEEGHGVEKNSGLRMPRLGQSRNGLEEEGVLVPVDHQFSVAFKKKIVSLGFSELIVSLFCNNDL